MSKIVLKVDCLYHLIVTRNPDILTEGALGK